MNHVFPIGDIKRHILEGLICECNPKIEWENSLIIHNSFDKREIIEQADDIKRRGFNHGEVIN